MKTTDLILAAFFQASRSIRARLICHDGLSTCVSAWARGNDRRILLAPAFFRVLALALVGMATMQAAPPSWNFQPRKVGQALMEGGWSLEYPLGEINASPEFSFPLQLVYLSTREASGLFSCQWVCPQLESSLVPKGEGLLL